MEAKERNMRVWNLPILRQVISEMHRAGRLTTSTVNEVSPDTKLQIVTRY